MAVVGMIVAAVLAVLALSAFVWAGYLAALWQPGDPEPSMFLSGPQTSGEVAAIPYLIVAVALGFGAGALWKWSHRFAWPEGDPVSAALMALIVVWYGGLALLVLWVVLRVTGVMGPIVSKHGL